jgi:hypothetical protein
MEIIFQKVQGVLSKCNGAVVPNRIIRFLPSNSQEVTMLKIVARPARRRSRNIYVLSLGEIAAQGPPEAFASDPREQVKGWLFGKFKNRIRPAGRGSATIFCSA